MSPAELRQAVRILLGMGYLTAGDVLAAGKRLKVVRNG